MEDKVTRKTRNFGGSKRRGKFRLALWRHFQKGKDRCLPRAFVARRPGNFPHECLHFTHLWADFGLAECIPLVCFTDRLGRPCPCPAVSSVPGGEMCATAGVT
ncbi:hypothetical protein JAAARDRAFT_631895 [Jaapia argillacea MUCL 33604]|uniref:Uncharacterized protein n=1 Tax=Jaapia argillacea MUCL 33604 TaxID=933084 RepID=A0A067PYG6_9AGAM|nr:hypothetical protein JAAARDRAFT_631895 [Jaapia argillacea MUCL 33604]